MSITIFKRSVISLAVLGFASLSHAGTFTGVFLGAEGLDLQVRNGDLDYVTVFPDVTVPNPSFDVFNLSPKYHWGWRVFGGITFCGDEDVTVSWLRYRHSITDSIADPTTAAQLRWLDTSVYTGINGKVTFDLDEAYAVYGHTFNSSYWSLRLAGGVEWARLNSNLGDFAFCVPCVANFGYTATDTTRGWGPRGEMDLTYHMPFGLGVFAKTNAALLIGSRDIALDTSNLDLGAFPNVYFSNRHVVVPKVGMKLGVGYTYVFGATGGEGAAPMTTSLSVCAGWEVDTYIHAIERPLGAFSPNNNLETKTSNFSTQGLFLGVKVGADWV